MIDSADTAALLGTMMNTGVGRDGQKVTVTPDQVDKVGKDFESMFISQMMESMFGDSVGEEAFGSSETGEVYKSMMMDAYGKEIAKAGGIGIADYVKQSLMKNELLKVQETAQQPLAGTKGGIL